MSSNDNIRDGTFTHEVGLRRLGARLVRDLVKVLNEADRELLAKIEVRLREIETRGFDRGPFTTARLEALMHELRGVNAEAYNRLGLFLRKELRNLAEYEVEFQAQLVADSVGGDLRFAAQAGIQASRGALEVSLVRPSIEQLVSLIEAKPLADGRPIARWARDLSAGKLDLFERSIQQGMLQGENLRDIMKRFKGSPGSPGLVEIPKRHLETWALTAMHHTANEARDQFYDKNRDVVKALVIVATLDDRTCEQCVPRDGKRYTLDHKPIGHAIPWGAGPGRYHPRDRCTSRPELKSWRELGINLKEAPAGTRESMDGAVSASLSAEEWLRKHPERAVKLYGKERATLFLEGGVSAEDLVKKDGTLWTLSDLREREKGAYRKAGLAA